MLGDGVITGYGMASGRQVFVRARLHRCLRSLSGALRAKICKVMDLADVAGAPVVGLNRPGRRADSLIRYWLRQPLPQRFASVWCRSFRSSWDCAPAARFFPGDDRTLSLADSH